MQTLKGVAQPMPVYRVLGTSGVRSRVEVAARRGLTPLVGREQEVGVLLERWAQVQDSRGQAVLLSGDAGIGKSRLLHVLTEHLAGTPHARLECRSSPYYHDSALYPLIDLLQRALHAQSPDGTQAPHVALEQLLEQYHLATADTVPLLARLLSIPLPDGRYPPLAGSPQQQRQKTLEALLALLLAQAAQQPVLFILEDLHWTDPSTLEWLTLLLAQVPTVSLLTLLTCRPEFQPPWGHRSYLTPLALQRFTPAQIETMVLRVTGGKSVPAAVMQHLVEKADGVPLYVEEMTRAILESGVLQEADDHYALTGPLTALTIPSTLQDALMARLDRLGTAKGVAQLGATIGRQFPYALLQAVAQGDESTMQQALAQLVEAELLYQHGIPPQATYTFKHALIQDTAYESLLRSTRQQLHGRIAQVLEGQFPETVETQPELLAHHYTEAGLTGQAIPYWQSAGQKALQRSANPEAVQHLAKGLNLLSMLPETPVRIQQELGLQVAIGPALMATKGWAAPEVEQTYARARVLCQQVGETPQLFPILRGLGNFYGSRGALHTARELGEHLLGLAQREAAPIRLLEAHESLGNNLFFLGEYTAAQTHLAQCIALADLTAPQALMLRHSVVPEVTCLAWMANTLWCLGYPTQAIRRSQEALAQAQTHPHTLALAQHLAAYLHFRLREAPAVQAHAEALLTLAATQQLPLFTGMATFWRGWALAMQGHSEAGVAQIHQGLEACLAVGQKLARTGCLVLLAEAAWHAGQVDEGLHLLAEAPTAFEANERGDMLTEVYRLQGELLLRQTVPDAAQAEACFQQALAIARRQQAKSWELRAAMSLARLWQQQGKRQQAHELLAPVYGWFTEGFDTTDLQEAKALLDALA
jgi:predicted ATPase